MGGKNKKTIFYCHYPDKLLTERKSLLKKLYRAPIDYLEEVTTRSSDVILVNSKYTQDIFKQSFSRIKQLPKIIYPALNFDNIKKGVNPAEVLKNHEFATSNTTFFLSINRFERKKNIALAVEAFSLLKTNLLPLEFINLNLHLVIAGGFDPALKENREVYHELKSLVDREGLNEFVSFMPSFSETEKEALLSTCFAVIYTPSNEHFGIVPVESMYFEKVCNFPSSAFLSPLFLLISSFSSAFPSSPPSLFFHNYYHNWNITVSSLLLPS